MENKKPPVVVIGVLNLIAIFVLSVNTLYAQNPKIKCYFNHPVNNSVATGANAIYLNTTFVDTVIAYINRAKYTLDVCVYNYTYNSGDGLNAIATAINNAYNRGVVIRWIYDGSSSNTGLPLLNTNIKTLGSPTSVSYGIMHNKFIVIDVNSTNASDAIVWTGSFNFSRQQSDVDYNNIIIFQDKALALAYYNEFNKMWGGTAASPNLSASKFGPFKTPSTQTSFTVNGTPVEVYFSPMDNLGTHLKNQVNTASTDLFFGIYTFTDSSIANTIKNKKLAGLSVRGIMDSFSQSYNPNSILSPVMGTDLKIYSGAGLYHNKVMLIDESNVGSDPQTWTGSFNWSISAETKNDENAVVVHDATITNEYYQSLCQNFAVMGGTACSPTGIAAYDYGTLEAIVFPNPATDVISVKVKHAGESMHVKVIDLSGSVLTENECAATDEAKLDVKAFPAGMYFILVDRNGSTLSQKFIKQ